MSSNEDTELPPVIDHHLQEMSKPLGFDSAAALKLLAALHLGTTAVKPGTVRESAAVDQFTRCSSAKRQSPSFLSSQEPSSKRAALLHPSSVAIPAGDRTHVIHGFTRLPLSPANLTRTYSAPVHSPGIQNLSNNQLPPEIPGVNSSATATPSQPLYRTYSEPIPVSYPAADTPPRPPAAVKAMLSSPGSGEAAAGQNLKQESPNTKRLERMRARLREMAQWWDKVLKEGEETNGPGESDHTLPEEDSEVSRVSETEEEACQEAVWVEKIGESLILHFKCPCRKGYQILLCGKNCYYKLTTF